MTRLFVLGYKTINNHIEGIDLETGEHIDSDTHHYQRLPYSYYDGRQFYALRERTETMKELYEKFGAAIVAYQNRGKKQ